MVTTLTSDEVRAHFRAAQCDGIPLIPECEACGNRGIALFAATYRHWKRERGFHDPANLCPTCAAINEGVIDFDED
jgi:hypothetical protein